MMSELEAQSHLNIAHRIWTEQDFHAFRKRCPGCRHVLNVGPWINGMRVIRCNWCAWQYREHPLR